MTPSKNRERILEAIDQLRHRKARPDVHRICSYLFRRFGINSSEAREDLQWCVNNNIVLKVEYKGNISYRNAAKKYGQSKQKDEFSDKANRKFAQLLTNAIGELIVNEPDYLELGVPSSEIIDNILSKDHVRYNRKYIGILMDKELRNGGLVKLENGNFLLGPCEEEERKGREIIIEKECRNFNFDLGIEGSKSNHQKERFEGMRKSKLDGHLLRVGGRRKRAKKVFDPSDSHVPRKRGRPAGSLNKATIEKQLARMSDESRPGSRTSSNGREQGGVCSVCHNQNKKSSDKMVACRECSNKAHISCLNGEDMMLRMYPDNSWQCPHCKTCVVCYETSDAGYLTVCSVCADAYHAGCHQPRIIDKPRPGQRWLCSNCNVSDDLKINEIQRNIENSIGQKTNSLFNSCSNSGTSSPTYLSPPISPTPPQLSPQNQTRDSAENTDQSNKDSDFDENIDPSIPDATHWSTDEVYQYFHQYFPEEAIIFKEQEIDGRSLLLLTRIDVLTNLKLKLGPALKIYKHVVKLQVRRDDPKLYWL